MEFNIFASGTNGQRPVFYPPSAARVETLHPVAATLASPSARCSGRQRGRDKSRPYKRLDDHLPRVIDYPTVRDTLLAQGLISLYHNSGAFGFPASASPQHVGWIGPPDPTIRPAALAMARHVPPPFERNLAELAAVAWQQHLPGAVWVMPRSHWAYELDFGSREWMPELLQSIDVDAEQLITRNDGTSLEFDPVERDRFVHLVEGLLQHLHGSSDFALAFPGRPTLCTVHHHKQLWWSTTDATVAASLDRLVPKVPPGPVASPG